MSTAAALKRLDSARKKYAMLHCCVVTTVYVYTVHLARLLAADAPLMFKTYIFSPHVKSIEVNVILVEEQSKCKLNIMPSYPESSSPPEDTSYAVDC